MIRSGIWSMVSLNDKIGHVILAYPTAKIQLPKTTVVAMAVISWSRVSLWSELAVVGLKRTSFPRQLPLTN